MTDASALEARKQIMLIWSRIKLDPRAVLGGVIAPLLLKRRSGEDGSPPR